MKTKSVVFALIMALISVVAVAADPVGPKVVVINHKGSGIFKVIYEGAKAGRVSINIFDKAGQVVYADTFNGLSGFILPVNFNGMKAGEYIIEITDASGKQNQKVKYAFRD